MSKTVSRKRRIVIRSLVALFVLMFIVLVGTRIMVRQAASGRMYGVDDVPKCKVALVLGSRVFPDGKLSGYTADRVDTAIRLYKAGKVEKLLMSGDNRFNHYNEPQWVCTPSAIISEDVGR